jgi:serine/threonine protein phosphatase 1
MQQLNIIGDIAGQYKTLLALLKKMPPGGVILAVGDLVDRGPRSREVLDYMMDPANHAISLLGNHELMMQGFFERQDNRSFQPWAGNGGLATLDSFGFAYDNLAEEVSIYLEYIQGLDLFYETPDLIVTHAPLRIGPLPDTHCAHDSTIVEEFVWNREAPQPRDKFQIFGHNSYMGFKTFKADSGKEYAACIDTSLEAILTGMCWPSREIFHQKYID